MTSAHTSPDLPEQVSPPRFTLSGEPAHAVDGVSVIAVPVLPGEPSRRADADGANDETSGPVLGPSAEWLTTALGFDVLDHLAAQRVTGRAGEVHRLPLPAGTADRPELRTVLFVGVGDLSATSLRRAGAATARAVKDEDSVAASVASVTDSAGITAFVVGAILGSFGFHWRSEGPTSRPVTELVLAGLPDAEQPAVDRGVVLGTAGWRSRFLATVPSQLKNPQWLAGQAADLAASSGLECTVWDENKLADEGFGGMLAVGAASATPPRLIRLDYTPKGATRRTPRVVLVGKGITFDSGGLSIKPADGMVTMKRDMTGGAVVMATMAALRAVGCPVRVTGLVTSAENAVSGTSYRPGDVIRHYGGRTTEVTNTDAEGRLVMADGIAYAVDRLQPAAIVDVATLTGAMKVALGLRTGGYFANDEGLASGLAGASERSGEQLWRMPLTADYEALLESDIADADNAAGGPGAITAALFLEPFAGDVPWAHLDIASVGDSSSEHHEWTSGPTGFGPRALLEWLGGDPLAGVGEGR